MTSCIESKLNLSKIYDLFRSYCALSPLPEEREIMSVSPSVCLRFWSSTYSAFLDSLGVKFEAL